MYVCVLLLLPCTRLVAPSLRDLGMFVCVCKYVCVSQSCVPCVSYTVAQHSQLCIQLCLVYSSSYTYTTVFRIQWCIQLCPVYSRSTYTICVTQLCLVHSGSYTYTTVFRIQWLNVYSCIHNCVLYTVAQRIQLCIQLSLVYSGSYTYTTVFRIQRCMQLCPVYSRSTHTTVYYNCVSYTVA